MSKSKVGYQCKVCLHKGHRFPGGLCPACNSANISPLNKTAADEVISPKRKKLSMIILIISWASLLYTLYTKLFL